METRDAIVLRHKPTGLYYSRELNNTKSLFKAWRFYDQEQLDVWLSVSIYIPSHPEEYEAIPVVITIERSEPE